MSELDRLADDGNPLAKVGEDEPFVDRNQDDDEEMQIECPYCDGDGMCGCWIEDDGTVLTYDCPECGGTGWC